MGVTQSVPLLALLFWRTQDHLPRHCGVESLFAETSAANRASTKRGG